MPFLFVLLESVIDRVVFEWRLLPRRVDGVCRLRSWVVLCHHWPLGSNFVHPRVILRGDWVDCSDRKLQRWVLLWCGLVDANANGMLHRYLLSYA